MKNIKNHNGITLMALVITIIILIILASIGTYSGIQVVKSAQFTAFSTELKIMQTQVNKLYEEKKNGNDDVDALGKTISSSSTTVQSHATNAFNASGITDTSNYKYFDTDTIKSLNIEGVEGEFFVNVDKRSVVSYDGFEYEGATYYTINQLPDSLYNVEYNTSEEQPDFDVDYELLENGKCKISVNNINYNGNINKWKVKYKKENEEDWKQSNNYSFTIDELGNYRVKIANNNIESNEKQIIAKTLPSEYQQVEYIESTGTQYIDTKVVTSTQIQTNFDFEYTDINSSYNRIFGAAYSNGSQYGVRGDRSYMGYFYGELPTSKNETVSTVMLEVGKRYKIRFNENENFYINDVAVNMTTTNKVGWQNIFLFSHNGPDLLPSKIKLYSCTMFDNSNKIRNFIPCYHKSDNKPGLYDLVNNEFYTNQGTGDFEKGNDIDSGKRIEQIIINDL